MSAVPCCAKVSRSAAYLRVATFNVHGPVDRVTGIVALFRSHSLDVVCFQEIDPRSLRQLAERLTELSGVQWQTAFGGKGNGLLTRCEIVLHDRVELRCAATRELRAALRCVVKHCFASHCSGGVCCNFVACIGTHLDWRREEARLEQLHQLLDDPWEDNPIKEAGYLLCGDLNALTRTDYCDKEWERIAQDRRSAGFYLQGPRGDLLAVLRERGFSDSAACKSAAPLEPGLWTTSRFRTRIDYILSSRDFRGTFANYRVVDAQSGGLSDHNLVYVDVFQ